MTDKNRVLFAYRLTGYVKVKLVVLMLVLPLFLKAQNTAEAVHGWQLLDLKEDGVMGISMEKTYRELLKDRKAIPVIVAVIDGGVDPGHEDLNHAIWVNKKEKPGNKKDDDGNGYVDDVMGWNFLGSSKGNFSMDNMDVVRQLRIALKNDPSSDRAVQLTNAVNARVFPLKKALGDLDIKLQLLKSLTDRIGKEKPTEQDFRACIYRTHPEERLLIEVVNILKIVPDFNQYLAGIKADYKLYKDNLNYQLNIDYDPRSDPEFSAAFHGNSDAKGPNPFHGSHAAGVIAADRNNNIGIKGVADQAVIMSLRVVADAGEVMDGDIAAAIRYAADNGAKVINMSMGKSSYVDRKMVEGAVRYAMEKDVLIVHAAGNNGMNVDFYPVYPTKTYESGDEAGAWIEVGASNVKDDGKLLAWFSNYSKTKVDVCAPGVGIYSAWSDNRYESSNGTSMAAPVVSGLAAMLRAYYPKLSAVQVKEIILKSVHKIAHKVYLDKVGADVPFSDVCKSGGIVNAYNAFKLAENY